MPETERVLWTGQSSQIENLRTFVLCGLVSLTVIGILIALPVALWRYLVTRNRSYKLTEQRLIITSGVLSRTNEQVELFRVKDITFEEPFFLRLFSLGRLLILSTDRTDPVAILNAVAGGDQLVETFRSAVTQLRLKGGVRVLETM